jgi:hypothetical protein
VVERDSFAAARDVFPFSKFEPAASIAVVPLNLGPLAQT